ncbi:MAG: endonuclease III [Oscillospiraceae bacterium]|jgi:endonuclease-3|nr:endonuclease III [Oscillospiraceae bacterium]
MISKTAIKKIIAALEAEYPDALCSLEYDVPWQLLFATRLSAQCTDERVNRVTPALFSRYPTLEAFAVADILDVEDLVHSCGFYHHKAADLIACAQMLLSDFNGVLPDTMEQLLKLPGVGRKTANIILGDIYNKPAVVTDTHCIRLANRMGMTVNTDPYKVELDLAAIIPPAKQSNFCHRLVLHGRASCTARKPNCPDCCLTTLCPKLI